ncbi:MAG: hypothetical protein DCC68_11555 [Planctomycetota bacterium]|nr:MAG: hypothetical protein DCC68_11555 [Planctomycetota bacterium]
MSAWNPRLPECWAHALGLVSVPMFGAARARNESGTHAIMLDGRDGSFALSIVDSESRVPRATANQRAWSANVRWSVELNQGSMATLRRWDAPDLESQQRVETEDDVAAIFDQFQQTPSPSENTVIDRALETFGAVRAAVEKRGGNSVDVAFSFNILIAWVATVTGDDTSLTLFQAARALRRVGAPWISEANVSDNLRDFPLGELVSLLRDGGSSGYLLDADLLVRHASGTLYQEAHKELRSPGIISSQRELFPEFMVVDHGGRRDAAPSYIHHTPESLARALIEVALKFVQWPNEGPFSILDPACGSGVFLIEAFRELIASEPPTSVQFVGIDKSKIAVTMAEHPVRYAISESEDSRYSLRIVEHDSLAIKNWGKPNIVLMNPPFVAWNELPPGDRQLVKSTLGPAYSDRPDIALAFIFKAAESLAPGGVLATVMPSSFLDSRSAELIRRYFSRSGKFRIHLIGQLHFGYFDATVQPAFLVISRSADSTTPIRVVIADDKSAEQAIRLLRSTEWTTEIVGSGFELRNIEQLELANENWSPQSAASAAFIREILHNTLTTVADFFVPKLGVRVGNKPVFILDEGEFRRFCTRRREQRLFRPIADRIENGIIQPSGYIFYPYDESGGLLLKTEQEVRTTLPVFFEERLRPAKRELSDRKSLYRNWWEVSRPVATWLAKRVPRIVSKEFGKAGDFAIDPLGVYAVVQGFGWCWKRGKPHTSRLLAYLAILNSSLFERILPAYCPQIRGGQFTLRRHFVERVPLPSLSDNALRNSLAAIGRRLATGKSVDAGEHESLVMRAYGLDRNGKAINRPDLASERLYREFKLLSQQWEEATLIMSREDRRIAHPLYKRIVDLGTSIIPYLLREIRDGEVHWDTALRELTGSSPANPAQMSAKQVSIAWFNWGRDNGYEI